jgi:hypothetical protein
MGGRTANAWEPIVSCAYGGVPHVLPSWDALAFGETRTVWQHIQTRAQGVWCGG